MFLRQRTPTAYWPEELIGSVIVLLMRPYGSKRKSAPRWAVSVNGERSCVSAYTIAPLKLPCHVFGTQTREHKVFLD